MGTIAVTGTPGGDLVKMNAFWLYDSRELACITQGFSVETVHVHWMSNFVSQMQHLKS